MGRETLCDQSGEEAKAGANWLISRHVERCSSAEAYGYEGNYLLVLKGSCDIEGVPLAAGMLVVAKTIVPQPYSLSASTGSTCLAMGVSF